VIRHAHDTTMYHISELGDEERKYLFNRHSFAEYATEVENFERFNSAAMLRIAEQRDGITEPSITYDRVRAEPTKLHWMLGQGQCRFLKIDGRFILSSEDFGKVVNGSDAGRACRYCVADFLHR
jgi:hypothetical protein